VSSVSPAVPRGLLVAALLLGLLAPGVSATDDPFPDLPAPSATVDVPCAPAADGSAEEHAVSVDAGATVLLRLCVQPSTGYRWSDPIVTDPAILAPRGWTFAGPPDDVPGAPGAEELLFLAGAPGVARVFVAEVRPWEGTLPGSRVVTLAVTVAGDGPAASPPVDRAAAADATVLLRLVNASRDPYVFASEGPSSEIVRVGPGQELMVAAGRPRTWRIYWNGPTETRIRFEPYLIAVDAVLSYTQRDNTSTRTVEARLNLVRDGQVISRQVGDRVIDLTLWSSPYAPETITVTFNVR